jgi:hypothetical protein
MNDISSREEEFFPRFERFKARMRELRGLRVNQFMGLLDQNQQRKVLLIEKEVEEFVRKFAYGGGLSPLLQEGILTAFNSDQVMRRRIELQSSGISRGSGMAPVVTQGTRSEADPGPGAAGRSDAGAESGGNGARSTGFFNPTPTEISRQATSLMGGKRVSDQSLAALQQAISRKLGGNGSGPGSGKQVMLALTGTGKVAIKVGD